MPYLVVPHCDGEGNIVPGWFDIEDSSGRKLPGGPYSEEDANRICAKLNDDVELAEVELKAEARAEIEARITEDEQAAIEAEAEAQRVRRQFNPFNPMG